MRRKGKEEMFREGRREREKLKFEAGTLLRAVRISLKSSRIIIVTEESQTEPIKSFRKYDCPTIRSRFLFPLLKFCRQSWNKRDPKNILYKI